MSEMLLCKFCRHYSDKKCDAGEVYPVYVGEDCNSFDNRYSNEVSGFDTSSSETIPDHDHFEDACGAMGFLIGFGKL